MTNQAHVDVIAENLKVRYAYSLSSYSLGGLTSEQFAASHPGVDPATLLDDPVIARQVEIFAGLASLQDAALSAQLRRSLRDAVSLLTDQMRSRECTPGVARDIGELLTKIGGLLDRRADAGRDHSADQPPMRRMSHAFGDVEVTTPEAHMTISITGRASEDALKEVICAMRCTTDAEVAAVVGALRQPIGTLNLPGF